jgi:hypothetical protein
MSGTGSNPADAPRLLAMSIDELSRPACGCGCGCECCGGEAPFGRRPPGPSDEALKERARYLGRLIAEAKALLLTAQEALRVGATTAAEIRDMQRLEVWLGRLLVEEVLHPPPKKK